MENIKDKKIIAAVNTVKQDITKLSPKEFIIIKGARQHNLKNIDVAIPRNKMIVITGLSGSGKSSLAFDTLYAEGQRRYVESLSAYARQFLGRLEKPQVDYIKGISPAIAIEQKVISRNPRSTVGTITEIYDYFKLLFSRVGKTFSPISGKQVKRQTVTDVVNFIVELKEGSKALILSKVYEKKDRPFQKQLELLEQQGFSRAIVNDKIQRINEIDYKTVKKNTEVFLLIDRLVTQPGDEDFVNRAGDSIQTAFQEGEGECLVWVEQADGNYHKNTFSNLFELDGMTFEEPTVNFFTFNNPIGACKTCEGFGSIIGIDPDLVIPNKSLSVYESAIVCWNGEVMSSYKNQLLKNAHKFNFPVHKPIIELSKKITNYCGQGISILTGFMPFSKCLRRKRIKYSTE